MHLGKLLLKRSDAIRQTHFSKTKVDKNTVSKKEKSFLTRGNSPRRKERSKVEN